MRQLAAEAEVSVTTLYNLFGSKDGVVVAMIDAALDQMDARLEAEAPVDLDPFGRCRAVITVSIEHLTARPEVYRPVNLIALERMARGEPDDRRLARRAEGMQVQGLAAARDQGLLRPGVDIDALAGQIFHGYELAAMQWATERLDAGAFEARALHGLWIALLAACTEPQRPPLERELAITATALREISDLARTPHQSARPEKA